MPNTYFQFKQFRINQERSGLKVTTDACLFGAWVANSILQARTDPERILDIGTGTGLLALMLAQMTGLAPIEAIDMNEGAYTEAKENFKNSPWKNRLKCTHSSLQKFDSPTTFDLIICNPPFFGKNQKGSAVDRNQAIHNDHLTMEDLSVGISRLLSQDGTAWVLYPEWEMKAFTKWMEKVSLFPSDQAIVRNKVHTSIFRIIGGFTRRTGQSKRSEVLLRQQNGNYSAEFSRLVEAYYL